MLANSNLTFAAGCTAINPQFSKDLWTNFSATVSPIITSANQAKTASEALLVANMIQSKLTTIQTAASNFKATMPHFDCLTSPASNTSSPTTSNSGTPYKPDPLVSVAGIASQQIFTQYKQLESSSSKLIALNSETTSAMKQLISLYPLPTNTPWNKTSKK